MEHPTRMVVLRTDTFESLLQELWALRPELKDKPTVTIHCGITALIRETKLTLAALCPKSFSPDSEVSIYQRTEASDLLQEEEVSDFSQNAPAEEPHPDSIWRQ
jgi:hypothetical protein